MRQLYPKHYLLINGKTVNVSDNLKIMENFDKLYNILQFKIPKFLQITIKKYVSVKVYFNWFNTRIKRDNARLQDCHLIFDGYIDSFSSDENKSNGLKYDIKAFSSIGQAFERTTETKIFNGDIITIIKKGLTETKIFNVIPKIIINGISNNLILKINSSHYFGDVLKKIQEDYAIKIYQTGDGTLIIRTPRYFLEQSIEAYIYDLKSNITSINYGEQSNNIDSVIVYGNNNIGIAFDPISYQLKNDVELQNNEAPQLELLNPLRVNRRDLISSEDCQEVARNILLDTAKNYTITFDTHYLPEQNIGDWFVIKNSTEINQNQKWIIKSREINISKNIINCNIQAYSNSVQDFPKDILLSNIGVLDTDILNVTNKIENQIQFN